MTILVLKTIGLMVLLGVGGFGGIVWLVPRLRLNILLTVALSLLLGIAVYTGLAQTLLFNESFEYVDKLVWLLAALGLVSALVAAYKYRQRLAQPLRPRVSHGAVLALSLVVFAPIAIFSILYPLTAWDAKMIWMVKAKAIYVEPHLPNTLFDSALFDSAHKDYPLGLPTLVASHYRWYQGVSEQPVALTYVIFLWLIVLTVTGALLQFAGRTALGIAAALVIIFASGDFLYFAGLGLADIPLSAMFTVSLLGLWGALLSGDSGPRRLWLSLGGFFALASAMFKNEGAPFIILYALAAAVIFWFCRRSVKGSVPVFRVKWGRAAAWLLAYATVLLPLLLWHQRKAQLGYEVDLFLENVNRSVPEYLDRTIETVHWFIIELPSAQNWGWALLPAVLLAIAGAVVWIIRHRSGLMLVPLALLVGQLGVYVVIYIVSPHDLTWHVTTSIDRLLVQVVPALYLSTALLWLLLLSKKSVYSTD